MISHESYLEFLKSQSLKGQLYRRLWLYPRICWELSGRVLDVGCGLGDMLAFRPNTIGVDINPGTVEWCQKRGLDARLMQPDVLPFQDGEFSGAVLDNVLEHLVAPEPLLSEIHRVLVPGGRLVVGVPGIRGYNAAPDHKTYYDESTLAEKLLEFKFFLQRILHMPLRSHWLSCRIPQYCIYGVFSRR